MIEDIYKRTKLLSKTCLKIALVLPAEVALCNLVRGHLIERATDMAIKSKGLMVTQNPDYFLKKLSEAKEATDGCQYWLELIKDEEYLDSHIINPILEESVAVSNLFALAIRKIKPNY
jgi:hypothetical protein